MKNKFILQVLLAQLHLPFLAGESLSSDYIEHSHCDKIGDFCHHKSPGIACLRLNKNLTSKNLEHFVMKHLGTDIFKVDMSSQHNLSNDTLKLLADSERAKAIQFLNLKSTKVSYSGIVDLWNSSTFGSLVTAPTYEYHTGTPLSTIEIEIGNTRVFKQYTKRMFNYPLPLHKDFEITFGHEGVGNTWKALGFKQIKLLDYGKELTKQTKITKKKKHI